MLYPVVALRQITHTVDPTPLTQHPLVILDSKHMRVLKEVRSVDCLVVLGSSNLLRVFVLFCHCVLAGPVCSWLQFCSWMLPSRRSVLPAARAQPTLAPSIAQDLRTAATSTSPSATGSALASVPLPLPLTPDAAVDGAITATGRSSAGDRVGGFTACCGYGLASDEKDKFVEGEPKIVDVRQFDAEADEIYDDDSIEDGEGRIHHFGS